MRDLPRAKKFALLFHEDDVDVGCFKRTVAKGVEEPLGHRIAVEHGGPDEHSALEHYVCVLCTNGKFMCETVFTALLILLGVVLDGQTRDRLESQVVLLL